MSNSIRHDAFGRSFNRRQVLKAGAGVGAAAFASRRLSQRAAAQDSPISIPDPQIDLPTENVTFRWVDSGDVKAFFWREFFPLYEEKHPNITMQYDPLPWNEIQQVVPLGVRNGNAHDVFQIPLNIPGAQAVREGWVAPLNDVIPNFEEWKAAFPEGVFVPGITDFDGLTYTLPLTSNRRHGNLTLYNREYMNRAGFNPEDEPFTWETFREAARVITEQGNGQYYGLIFEGNQVNRFAAFVLNLGRRAGSPVSTLVGDNAPFDWRTGDFAFTRDEFIAAAELLVAINDDGSIFPGSLSLNAPQARAQFPNGVAGMISQGPWNISQWKVESPDFDFGVAPAPQPAEGATPHHVSPGGDNPLWIFRDSDLKEIAGDILSYVGSLEGQTAWAQIVGVADMPIFPEAQGAIGEDPEANAAIQTFQEQIRLAPDPRVRNPDAAQVYLELQPVTPSLGEIVQGIFVGQIEDIPGAFQELQDAWNTELDRAISVAQTAGADVSRDDFVFANWDPEVEYTAADYEAL